MTLTNVIYSLELGIHQRILTDIAANDEGAFAEQVLSSRVQKCGDIVNNTDAKEYSEDGHSFERVYMVSSCCSLLWSITNSCFQSATRLQCNIAFGELVVNFPDARINTSIHTVMMTLIDILRDVPHIDFDRSLSWTGIFL